MIDSDIFDHKIDSLQGEWFHLAALRKPSLFARLFVVNLREFENEIIRILLSLLDRIWLAGLKIERSNFQFSMPFFIHSALFEIGSIWNHRVKFKLDALF